MVAVLVFPLLAAARLILPIVPLTAIEDGGPVANLKHSWQISQGNFWRLLAVVLLTGLAAVTLLFATQSVVGSVATLLLGKPDPWTVSRLIVALAVAVVQTGVVTVASVLVARVYVQLAAAAKA
jgi:membrane-anchored glycerophosphoryl diester phosphodiesterase (GDPDase)